MFTFSNEHYDYLKKIKKEKQIIFFFRILIVILFMFVWEVLAQNSIINTFLFSSPSKVIETICSLYNNGDLLRHVGVSLYEVFISFFMASGIGIIVATILWSNERLSKIIDPYITILNSLPKVALGPLIIIWVGASMNSIIFMALMISVFVTIINIYNG
ncbi:MAG: ABC transporter permease subunit, partial [Bacilli bacterium]|nr:ABC transporter permease subunit [Bacilli bacterium]